MNDFRLDAPVDGWAAAFGRAPTAYLPWRMQMRMLTAAIGVFGSLMLAAIGAAAAQLEVEPHHEMTRGGAADHLRPLEYATLDNIA